MALEGGKRDRMILESVLRQVEADLAVRGWFNSGRQHAPVTVIDAYPGDGENVAEPALNTLAFSYGESFQRMLEMGSNAETHTFPIYIDFYGESDAVTRHIVGDIYAYLGLNPLIPVYDYDLATPAEDFKLEVVEESVAKSFPTNVTNPWQKHWGIVSFLVEEDRTNG